MLEMLCPGGETIPGVSAPSPALEMNRAVQQSYQNDLQNLSKKKEQDFRNERSMRLGQIEENKIARGTFVFRLNHCVITHFHPSAIISY